MEASLTLRILLLGFAAAATAGFGVARARRNVDETDLLAGTPASAAPGRGRGEGTGLSTDLDPVGPVRYRCQEDPFPPEHKERALEAPDGRRATARAPWETPRSRPEGRVSERIETDVEPQAQREA